MIHPVRSQHLIRLVPLLLLFAGVAVLAMGQSVYPVGTPLLGASPQDVFRLTNTGAGRVVKDRAAGPGFDQVWRLETTRDSSPSWAVEYKGQTAIAVAKGGVALVRCYARALATTDESGSARLRIVVQKSAADWDKSLEAELYVGSTWTEILLPFAFKADYAPGGAEVSFGIGYKRQTIEIGGVEFHHYADRVPLASLPRSRFGYPGREADAAWRGAALARIEQLRKGDFTVAVKTPEGLPLAGLPVSVEMTRHHFQWGSCYQMARIVTDSADNRLYRRKLLALFNAGTAENDLKWPPWAGEAGSGYSRSGTLAGLRWLKEHGFHVRGHVLVWPSWKHLPTSVAGLQGTPSQGDVPARVLAHIADIAGTTRPWIDEWDVENEPYANHDLMDLFGPSVQVDWFKTARTAHPDAPLFLNDYGNHDAGSDPAHVAHFEATAKHLLAQGAPLGGLGIQAHFGGAPAGPASILATFDRYALLGLPLRITEFDINTDDEEMQADYTRDFLLACFSHPSVVGVQLWGFWSKAHWLPNAALYRDDWSEKSNGRALRELVHEQWRTRASGTTAADGAWHGRGIFGDYVARLQYEGRIHEQKFRIRPGEPPPTVVLVPKPSRLGNQSSRAAAGGPEGPRIAGFVVEGGAAKSILLRAVGPGLQQFGVHGTLAQPSILVTDGRNPVAANRGWESSASPGLTAALSMQAGAFALQAGSADCAVVATLAPGTYAMSITGFGWGTGVCLAEVYDLEPYRESK